MELEYKRTDKNGTKIFYDWTCPRCGGAGASDKWYYTGRVCYRCGGSGKRAKPLIVRQYTDEYAAKLKARRQAKMAKEAEVKARYEADHAEEIEAIRREIIESRYAEFGCGKDGIGYAHSGNTYPIKDQAKKSGGKWIYGAWVCPVEITGAGITVRKVDLNGHIGSGSVVWLDDFDLYEAIRG